MWRRQNDVPCHRDPLVPTSGQRFLVIIEGPFNPGIALETNSAQGFFG